MLRMLAVRALDWKAIPPASPMPRKLLVVRWDGKLGDAVVSSFLYRELRKAAAVRIAVVTGAPLAKLHRQLFGADEVLVTRTPPGWLELLGLALRLRGVDTVLHLVGHVQPRELFFLRLLKPTQIYCLDDALACVTGKMGHATRHMQFAEKYAQVLLHMGVRDIDRSSLIDETGAGSDEHARTDILFNPYASRADKSIGPARAAQTLARLADALPTHRFFILNSPTTREHSQQLAVTVGRSNVRAVDGMCSVEDAIARVRTCAALVSVDTGVAHIAAGANRPLVAIYPHSEDFNPWLPLCSPRVRVIHAPQSADAHRRTGRKNMNTYVDSEVLGALQQLLRESA